MNAYQDSFAVSAAAAFARAAKSGQAAAISTRGTSCGLVDLGVGSALAPRRTNTVTHISHTLDSNYSSNNNAPSSINTTLNNDANNQTTTINMVKQANNRCYLCDIPKQEYSIIRSYSEPICRGCLNYEGPDHIEWLICDARKFKKNQSCNQSDGLHHYELRPFVGHDRHHHHHQHDILERQHQASVEAAGGAGAAARPYQVSNLIEIQQQQQHQSIAKAYTACMGSAMVGATAPMLSKCSADATITVTQQTANQEGPLLAKRNQSDNTKAVHLDNLALKIDQEQRHSTAGNHRRDHQADATRPHEEHQPASGAPLLMTSEKLAYRSQAPGKLHGGATGHRAELGAFDKVCSVPNCCAPYCSQRAMLFGLGQAASRSIAGLAPVAISPTDGDRQPKAATTRLDSSLALSHMQNAAATAKAAAYEQLLRMELAAVRYQAAQRQQQHQHQHEHANQNRAPTLDAFDARAAHLEHSHSPPPTRAISPNSTPANHQEQVSQYYASQWRAALAGAGRQTAAVSAAHQSGPPPSSSAYQSPGRALSHVAAYFQPASYMSPAAAAAVYCGAAAAAAAAVTHQFGASQRIQQAQRQYDALATAGHSNNLSKLLATGSLSSSSGPNSVYQSAGATSASPSSTLACGAADTCTQQASTCASLTEGHHTQPARSDFSLRRLLSSVEPAAPSVSESQPARDQCGDTRSNGQHSCATSAGAACTTAPAKVRSPPSRTTSDTDSESTIAVTDSPKPKRQKMHGEEDGHRPPDFHRRNQCGESATVSCEQNLCNNSKAAASDAANSGDPGQAADSVADAVLCCAPAPDKGESRSEQAQPKRAAQATRQSGAQSSGTGQASSRISGQKSSNEKRAYNRRNEHGSRLGHKASDSTSGARVPSSGAASDLVRPPPASADSSPTRDKAARASVSGTGGAPLKQAPLRCLMCGERLEDRHFVQCPSVAAHKFCFVCSRNSIELQQLENKTLSKIPSDKVFCPSGKRCFLATEKTSWTFMNSEIETIFRDTQAHQLNGCKRKTNSRTNKSSSLSDCNGTQNMKKTRGQSKDKQRLGGAGTNHANMHINGNSASVAQQKIHCNPSTTL